MLGGLINAAVGGAARGYNEVAEGELKNAQKLDFQKEILRLEEEKEMRAREDGERIRREGAQWNAGEGAEAVARGRLVTAPIEARAAVAGEVARETEIANTGLIAKRAGNKLEETKANAPVTQETARQAGAAAATETTTRVGTPGYTGAVRKEAQAKHVESLASVAQANLANLNIKEKEAAQRLIDEYDRPETTQERRDAIMRSLVVRGVVKPNETDVQTVRTETIDKEGNKVVTERKERRNAGASSTTRPGAAPQPAAGQSNAAPASSNTRPPLRDTLFPSQSNQPSAAAPTQSAPNSAAAQTQARAAAEQERRAEAARPEQERQAALRSSFDADLATLHPEELLRKYDKERSALTPDQRRQLKTSEQSATRTAR